MYSCILYSYMSTPKTGNRLFLLIKDMERSVAKREMIATKGKAVAARKGPDMTEQQLKNACNDLRRSIRDTDKESVATDQRIHELDEGRATLAANMESSSIQIRELKDEEQVLRQELDEVRNIPQRIKSFTTIQQQAMQTNIIQKGIKMLNQVKNIASYKKIVL